MQKIVKLNQAFLYCCMVVMFCLHSKGYAAPTQGKPVSITIKNSTLAEVLRQVSKKSGLYIYFQDADLAAHKNVTIDVRNKPVENVLHELLDGRGLSWVEVSENTIAVKKKLEVEDRRIEGDTVATITVTGKVVDEKGEPVIGATVLVKNDSNGATTNLGGEFVLKGVRANALVVISNVSFLTQEVAVKGRRNIGRVQLKEYVEILDETQVIAYGQTSRRFNTGNVGTIKATEIERQPINNPILALSGRIPGLQITQATGLAGSGVSILIQGQNSLTRGNDPFFVIDGVPYVSQLLPNLGNILGTSRSAGLSEGNNGNPLSFINPADIESIDVLKDADATAIYGSRAANGAILITTKKGTAGQTKINLNVQAGYGEVARKVKLLDTRGYLEMRKEAFANDGITNYPEAAYDVNGTWDQNRYTDWQEELIGNTAKYNDAQISFSGGNANTQYLVGAGYHKETTVFPSDLGDKKVSIHFNVNNSSLNQKFKISLSGNYMIDNNKLISTDLTSFAMNTVPNAPALYNNDGTINWETNSAGISTWGFDQPIRLLNNLYRNKTVNLVSSALISYEILNGLELKSSFGYTDIQSDEISTEPLSNIPPSSRQFYTRTAQYNANSISSWVIEPQISFKRALSVGQFSALLGTTIQQNNSNRKLLKGSGYNSDLVLENINAATQLEVPFNSAIASIYKYNAVFGRINYNVLEKYILNFTARRDGSSRFGRENQFHTFASIGAAWIFSEESAIRERLNIISFGKLKASIGTTGSDQIGDYQFMSLYDPSNPAVPYRGGSSLLPNNIANAFLQWEETRKIQVGLELGLWSDKIFVSTNYYNNRSSNQLLSYALPVTTGVGSIISNFPATVRNTGWEFYLKTTNVKSKKILWTSSFNLTVPQNKLVAFRDFENSTYRNDYIVGHAITTTRTYNLSGVDSKTGLYQFIKSDGSLTSSPSSGSEDRIVFINTAQKYYGGLQNAISFNGFELDFLFQFVKQLGLFNSFGTYPGFFMLNQPVSVLDRWRQSEDVATIQSYSTQFNNFQGWSAASRSDKAYSDASFIRLKNISISWVLPDKWTKQINMKMARFYVQGQNLLTITKYKGLDPETKVSSTLPPLRVCTVGFQISL